MTAEEICAELNINHTKVLNIYPYGLKIYLCDDEYLDSDHIIVFKSSLLPSGAFKDNAISSRFKDVQGVCYSESGFIDAINNYDITALECIFLPEDKIIQNKMNFGITKYNEKELSKKIITKASSSWHFTQLAYKDKYSNDDGDDYKYPYYSMKNVFHALRILDFGIQIKNHQKIVDYSSMNKIKEDIDNNLNFKPYDYYDLFMELSEKIKN